VYADALQDELIENQSGKSLKPLTGGWEIRRTEDNAHVTQLARQTAVSTRERAMCRPPIAPA
jgi:hypothetical protein